MYETYSTERLVKMREKAYTAYYTEAVKPCGDFRKGMKFTALEKARVKITKQIYKSRLQKSSLFFYVCLKIALQLSKTGLF